MFGKGLSMEYVARMAGVWSRFEPDVWAWARHFT